VASAGFAKKQHATTCTQQVARRWKADGGGSAREETRLLSDARGAGAPLGRSAQVVCEESLFQTEEHLSIQRSM